VKKSIIISLIFPLVTGSLQGQSPPGSWTDHLNYTTAFNVVAAGDKVYASTGSSLILYNTGYGEVKKLSTVTGLTTTGISALAWSEENSTLVIVYNSLDIDLATSNRIYNIPDIRERFPSGGVKVFRARTTGRHAYLATNSGIVVVDLQKKEITDTWNPVPPGQGVDVYDIAFSEEKVYAATSKGIFIAGRNQAGLSWSGNWQLAGFIPYPEDCFNSILYMANTLFCVRKGIDSEVQDVLFSVSEGNNYNVIINGSRFRSLDAARDGFTLASALSVRLFSRSGSPSGEVAGYGNGLRDISQAVADGDNIWIADRQKGLIMVRNMSEFSFITVNGPSSNHSAGICSGQGMTIICGGGTDKSFNGLERPFSVSVRSENIFRNYMSENVSDAMEAVIMPGSANHYFVSSWGEGLIEFRDNIPVNHYTGANSPLSAAYGTPGEINISGMATDKNGNLWMVHPGPGSNIKVLKPDGTWISNPALSNTAMTGDLALTARNLKIVIIPGGNGLFVLDDNNTPDLFQDDRSRRISIRDRDGNVMNNAYSIAVDLDGSIWVGTDRGPVIYYANTNFFEDDPAGTRIKIPRNDGSGLADYLLGTTEITCIAVDGGNSKWLGTNGSGTWLINDGTGTVSASFNTKNSPLLSDTITSLAVDDITGEVWFGTPKGVISFRATATGGAGDFSGIYPFPNPVREDFEGDVTITGLMRDTGVKITDISGNLVYETVSEGGQATWDLTTYDGRRVSTGVYVVFCSNSEGRRTGVTKILVIR